MLMRLDPASVGRFHDDGFLAFDTGLPEAEIATLHRTLTGLINRDAGFNRLRKKPETNARDAILKLHGDSARHYVPN